MTELALHPNPRSYAGTRWSLWRRWVAANALAELIGLGGSLLAGFALLSIVDEESVGGLLLLAAVAIVLGTFFEGVLVGLFQWRVLRDPLPGLARRSWVRATAAGAAIAWILGMLPSTILSLTMDASGAPASEAPVEPGAALVLLLAAGMGLVLGAILAAPQWLVLRRHVRRASWWAPANMLAWMVGMAVIFAGTLLIPAGPLPAWVIAVLLGCVVLAGISVGAIHGWFLVRLLPPG